MKCLINRMTAEALNKFTAWNIQRYTALYYQTVTACISTTIQTNHLEVLAESQFSRSYNELLT